MSMIEPDPVGYGALLKPDDPVPEPAKPRKPLRHMSVRKRARLAEQREISSGGVWCEMPREQAEKVGCTFRATDDHHRRPQSLTSEHDLIRLCRVCHEWAEQHPAEATRLGVSDITPKLKPNVDTHP